jgi:hypothetical protein
MDVSATGTETENGYRRTLYYAINRRLKGGTKYSRSGENQEIDLPGISQANEVA